MPGPTKGTIVAISFLAPAVLAVAAAVALAPMVAADEGDGATKPGQVRGSAQESGDRDVSKPGPRPGPPRASSQIKEVPKGWTNEAQWARPGSGGSNNFGSLPKPPIFALD